MSSDLKQIVMGFYNAFNHRNLEELDQVFQSGWLIYPWVAGGHPHCRIFVRWSLGRKGCRAHQCDRRSPQFRDI
jgi:hypothetical protein